MGAETLKTCSITEAAELLGVSDKLVRQWVNRPKAQRVPGFYTSNTITANGHKPPYRIWVDQLRAYAERQSFL